MSFFTRVLSEKFMAGHLDTRQYSQDLCHLMQFKKPMFINDLGIGRLYAITEDGSAIVSKLA